MIFLIIYLAGFAGTSTYSAINCTDKSSRMTTGECVALSTVLGAVWPVVMANIAYNKLTETEECKTTVEKK